MPSRHPLRAVTRRPGPGLRATRHTDDPGWVGIRGSRRGLSRGANSAWPAAAVLALLAPLLAPFADELVSAQLGTLLLLLLAGAWWAQRSGRRGLGGALLGLSIALKLLAWPLALYLALRRDWRALAATAAAFLAGQALAAAAMGPVQVLFYYRQVPAEVARAYQAAATNLSLWSLAWRAFAGTGSHAIMSLQAPPLAAAPALAPRIAWLLPALALGLGLSLALRARSFDTSFASLVCVSLLVSPIAWYHYFVLLAIPLALCVARLRAARFPCHQTALALLAVLALAVPDGLYNAAARLLAGQPAIGPAATTVPFAAGLITLAPALPVLAVIWLVWRSDRPEELGGSRGSSGGLWGTEGPQARPRVSL